MSKSRLSRKSLSRKMIVESLESRAMMAADAFHNFTMPEDADASGVVTPLDALVVINRINQSIAGNPSGVAPAGSQSAMVDVDADQTVTPLDALVVIDALNAQNSIGANGLIASRVDSQRRIELIEKAIELNTLPPELSIQDANTILETLRQGGRPELGDRIENGSLRWGQDNDPGTDDRPSLPQNDPVEFNPFIYAVSQRLQAFDVSTDIIEKISVEIRQANQDGKPMDMPQIRSRLGELGVDVQKIMPVSANSPELTPPTVGLPVYPDQPTRPARPDGREEDPSGPGEPERPEPPSIIAPAVMVTEPVAESLLARLAEAGVSEEILTIITQEIWDAINAGSPLDMLKVRMRLHDLGA
ncbi:MAG: dockerin type I domain-containing protein [Planctomycetaceae bacterium]|nr:dockerin type I domain-containing protein [Planctomycetaceae bacterium]